MAAANSTLVIVLVGVGAFGLGWFGHGKYYGTDVSTKESAKQGQQFVDAAVEDDRQIVTAQAESDAAEEHVRTIIRTVTVAGDCPVGRGPISPDLSDELRDSFGSEE